MRYNVFITTGDNKIWSTTEVARAYGVRWSRLRRDETALFFRNMVELLTLSPQKLKQQIALYGCYETRKDRVNMADFIQSF